MSPLNVQFNYERCNQVDEVEFLGIAQTFKLEESLWNFGLKIASCEKSILYINYWLAYAFGSGILM